eukprot:TRINITY_DN514_c2_g1_i2.p1 TRINITY_DN514_c2_g1~~TRINITY_DN514_c2_g1_i2.p1  ORF type:complete len:423 (+),score=99.03 TRINITY_DN514_c2_g1_i2:95-1363(+)
MKEILKEKLKSFQNRCVEQVRAGTPFALLLQKRRTRLVDFIGHVCANCGRETFYLPMFFYLAWVIQPRMSALASFLLGFSLTVGNILKNLFQSPRPPSPPIQILSKEFDWGFPSTHSINSITIPFYCFYYIHEHQLFDLHTNPMKSFLVFILLVMWSTIIMLSRIYLGVHSLFDIIGGIIVAIPILIITIIVDDTVVYLAKYHESTCIILPIIFIIILYFHPTSQIPTVSIYTTSVILGTTTGFYISFSRILRGYHPIFWLEDALGCTYYVSFFKLILRAIVGAAFIAIVKIITKFLLYKIFVFFCYKFKINAIQNAEKEIESLPSQTHLNIIDKTIDDNTNSNTNSNSNTNIKNDSNNITINNSGNNNNSNNNNNNGINDFNNGNYHLKLDIDVPVKYISYAVASFAGVDQLPYVFDKLNL